MFQKSVHVLLVLLVVAVIALVGYRVLNMKDQRTAGEKLNDATEAMSDGVSKASRQLEDRTPGERLGDAVKDVGDDIKDKSKM